MKVEILIKNSQREFFSPEMFFVVAVLSELMRNLAEFSSHKFASNYLNNSVYSKGYFFIQNITKSLLICLLVYFMCVFLAGRVKRS